MLRRIMAFVIAMAVMVTLGPAAHSLFVQKAWLAAAGQAEGSAPVALPFAERAKWILHDLFGLEPFYAEVTGGALLIACLVAGLVARFTGRRPIVFALAGAVAIYVMYAALKMSLGTVGIFGARGLTGMGAQMTTGLLAGLVFALLTRPRSG